MSSARGSIPRCGSCSRSRTISPSGWCSINSALPWKGAEWSKRNRCDPWSETSAGNGVSSHARLTSGGDDARRQSEGGGSFENVVAGHGDRACPFAEEWVDIRWATCLLPIKCDPSYDRRPRDAMVFRVRRCPPPRLPFSRWRILRRTGTPCTSKLPRCIQQRYSVLPAATSRILTSGATSYRTSMSRSGVVSCDLPAEHRCERGFIE
jgi:hypothetical protein